jgi:hypothetical protein
MVELQEERAEELAALDDGPLLIADFLTTSLAGWASQDVKVVITNPPFQLAMQFIRRAIEVAPLAQIAFLLRLNFLASEERAEFMQEYAPDIYVLPNRPSFVHGATDMAEYAWFVWPPAATIASVGARAVGRVQVLSPTPVNIRRPLSTVRHEATLGPESVT